MSADIRRVANFRATNVDAESIIPAEYAKEYIKLSTVNDTKDNDLGESIRIRNGW